MSDFYTEQLIKKQKGTRETLMLIGMIVLLMLGIMAVLVSAFGIIVMIAAIVADMIIFRQMNLEYEYLFVNGDFDVDKIMNKSRRKRLFSMNVNDLEILAPEGASELKTFKNVKVEDYSSGRRDAKRYGMVVANRGEKIMIIFEPNNTIVEGFFMLAPRKVIRK